MDKRRAASAWLAACAAVAVGLACVAAGVLSHPVERIRLSGDWEVLDRAELEVMLADYLGGKAVAFVDLEALGETLGQWEPWIHSASARRQLPGGVDIRIRERRPIAALAEGGYLEAEDQPPFYPQRPWPHPLPEIRAPGAELLAAARDFRLARRALAPRRMAAFAVDRAGNRQLRIALEAGEWRATFDAESFARRLAELPPLLAQGRFAPPPGGAASFDFRHPGGIAVGRYEAQLSSELSELSPELSPQAASQLSELLPERAPELASQPLSRLSSQPSQPSLSEE